MQDAMKSKRFTTYAVTAIVLVIIGLLPELEPHAEIMIAVFGALAGLVIKGYSDQDVESAKQGLNKYIPTLPEVQQPEAAFRNDTSEINRWAVTPVDLNEIAQG